METISIIIICKKIFSILENSVDYLVERFQRALLQHHQVQNSDSLYEPGEM